jgi:hypothetical protein
MASSYVNDLRLNEMATGDASGTWGDTTNTNLELIAEAFSYGTEAITTNADTHTTTIADGASDPGRALYLKYTGTLDSACTITIGPNTVSKVWIVENGTSGSQDIILSQGSGANITIPAGDTKVVYSDGAGAGAAFVDAFASLSVVDLKVQDDLTVTDTALVTGVLTTTATQVATGGITSGSDIISDTDSTDSLGSTGVRWLKGWFDTLTAGTLTVGSGSVTDSSGAISFGDENLTTTGIVTAAGTSVFTNLDISGDVDVDGTTNLDNTDIDGTLDVSGQATFADGSAGAPSISNTGDVNSGLFFSAADVMSFSAGGTAQFTMADGSISPVTDNDIDLGTASLKYKSFFAGLVDSENFKVNGGQGTDGQVLTSTGSGVAWEDAAGVGVTFKDGGANFTNSLMVGEDSTGTLSSANNNIGVGKGIFAALTSGNANAVLGNGLSSATTSERNVAIGHNALNDATTANNNVCIGYEAGGSLTVFSGNNNIAIGTEALGTLTDRADNIAIGYRAIGMNDAAVISQVVGIGVLALSDVAFGGYGNVALGYQAGYAQTSGLHNTMLGRAAGINVTTGGTCICIGYNSQTSASGTSEIVIGVNATGKGNTTGFIHPGGGGMYQGNNSANWSTVSDERIKKNITDNNIGLEAINKIQVRNFEYRTEDEIVDFKNPKSAVVKQKGIQLGVIAQEIEEIFPDVVKTEDTGVKTVNPDNLIWYLINAVQELSAEIKKLKGE